MVGRPLSFWERLFPGFQAVSFRGCFFISHHKTKITLSQRGNIWKTKCISWICWFRIWQQSKNPSPTPQFPQIVGPTHPEATHHTLNNFSPAANYERNTFIACWFRFRDDFPKVCLQPTSVTLCTQVLFFGHLPSLKLTASSPLKMLLSKSGISTLPGVEHVQGRTGC